MQSKKMKKEKMFISAYACEPYKGSEIGVGWNWVLQLSKKFEVWVLTRESNKENIEEWLSKQTDAVDIKFVYYDLPKALTVWKKGLRGVRLYYNLWQIFSNKIVKRIMSENDIDIYAPLTAVKGEEPLRLWFPEDIEGFTPVRGHQYLIQVRRFYWYENRSHYRYELLKVLEDKTTK